MNWMKLIADLQASGLSQEEIGNRLKPKKSQAWVSAVAKGAYKDVRWADGQALIALHDKTLGKPSPLGTFPVAERGTPKKVAACNECHRRLLPG